MDIFEIIKKRHSVRQYEDRKIEPEKRDILLRELDKINQEGHLHIQILFDEPKCFHSLMAHYGKFSGVTNYIAMIGKKNAELEEKCGYYGERLVLLAQQLGLNTCWVAMSYSKIKTAFVVDKGEKLCVVISLGYGETSGIPHKSRPIEEVTKADVEMPEWFQNGVKAALLAPTAMNQQKFVFSFEGNQVSAKAGIGFYTKLDLGIVKYHFEIGAGRDNFKWIS